MGKVRRGHGEFIFKKTKNANGIFICKVLGIDQRSQSWIIDKYIIFIRSDEDITLYKLGYNTVVAAMNNYEWLYEITRDEYIDILQRAIRCM